MTRIIGQLWGADGPLNGRLFVKAGGSFIGAPTKDLTFKIEDGIVDVELPACPPGMPYLVDWKNIGDASRLSYIERWRVPPAAEVSLDEVRGLSSSSSSRKRTVTQKTELLDATLLRSEVKALNGEIARLEEEKIRLLKGSTEAENLAAAARAQVASLSAELQQMNMVAYQATQAPQETIIERIVEKTMTPDEYVETIAEHKEQVELLRIENERLRQEIDAIFRLKTHFGDLHAEIDRLKIEKQQLLSRIEELKRPVRSASTLRYEAIANLDRMTGG